MSPHVSSLLRLRPRRPFWVLVGVLLLSLGPVFLGAASSPKVLAQVGKASIDETDFQHALSVQERRLGHALGAAGRSALLQSLINQKLLVDWAKDKGIVNQKDLRKQLEWAQDAVLAQAAYDQEIVAPAQVDGKDVRKYYHDHLSEFQIRQIRQIVILPKGKGGKAMLEAKSRASRILRQALAHPKDFAALARKDSDDPTGRRKGGSLGELKPGMLVAPLDSVAFAVDPGTIVGPLKSSFGYHILDVLSAKVEPFATVQNVIARRLEQQRIQALQVKFFKSLAKRFKVQFLRAP